MNPETKARVRLLMAAHHFAKARAYHRNSDAACLALVELTDAAESYAGVARDLFAPQAPSDPTPEEIEAAYLGGDVIPMRKKEDEGPGAA